MAKVREEPVDPTCVWSVGRSVCPRSIASDDVILISRCSFPFLHDMNMIHQKKTGSNSVLLTEATEKKTALLFVNQTSALAGKGHFSTQPPKCYAND